MRYPLIFAAMVVTAFVALIVSDNQPDKMPPPAKQPDAETTKIIDNFSDHVDHIEKQWMEIAKSCYEAGKHSHAIIDRSAYAPIPPDQQHMIEQAEKACFVN